MESTKERVADWFSVDRKGLRAVSERRNCYDIRELISNSWDEPGVTAVHVTLVDAGHGKSLVTVTDDAPGGFVDLSDSWTLFAPSKKNAQPELRGRFNVGEKFFLAACRWCEIVSVNGGVRFDNSGRKRLRRKTDTGTEITAEISMSNRDRESEIKGLELMLPEVPTTLNGTPLSEPTILAVRTATLTTEIADENGSLRRTKRKAKVRVVVSNGQSWLYELGAPIQKIKTPWSLDVRQKVPQGIERNAVSETFLRDVYVVAAEAMSSDMSTAEKKQPWIDPIIPKLQHATVRSIVEGRYGHGAVIHSPSQPESSKMAVNAGRSVVYGKAFSKESWKSVKESGALVKSTTAFPTGIPTSLNGKPPIPRGEWTHAMDGLAGYCERAARHVLGVDIEVFYANLKNGSSAWWRERELTWNLGELGKRFPSSADAEQVDAILIHELAHHYESDHLTKGFYGACCQIGAALRSFEERSPS